MSTILGIAAFGLVLWWLIRSLPQPPVVMSAEDLLREDSKLKPAQIRAEQRRQRAELRAHTNAQAHSVRAASQAARFVLRATRGRR